MIASIKRMHGSRVSVSIALAASIFLMFGISLPAAGIAAPVDQTMGGDMAKLEALQGKDFEIEFLNEMIPHHESAVAMANLALKQAAHPELKTAAQNIVSSQTEEINTMKGWLKSWYSLDPAPAGMSGMDGRSGTGGTQVGDMSSLEKAQGDSFDRAFLVMMRVHHQGAVDMAALAPGRADHSELKTLAQNITGDQTREIQQFESWLKSWYNIDVATMTTEQMNSAMQGGSTGSEGSPGSMDGMDGMGQSSSLPGTGEPPLSAGVWVVIGVTAFALVVLVVGLYFTRGRRTASR